MLTIVSVLLYSASVLVLCDHRSIQRVYAALSHIVLFVLVLLLLVAAFQTLLFVLHDVTVALDRGVGYVVAALVYLVGALVSVPVFVHGVQQDEDAQRCSGYYSDDHPCGAARFSDHL